MRADISLPLMMIAMLFLVFSARNEAAAQGQACEQAIIESGHAPPPTRATIMPHRQVQPFYEWSSNNGYCGETSLIQAGLNSGQWISQYNARLLCGAGLSQSGADGFCAAHGGTPNYNAQMLLEPPRPGDHQFADAATCLSNFGLKFEVFHSEKQKRGLAGYKQYLSWIKSRLLKGEQVVIGVLERGMADPEYDHIVTVVKVGTNHSPKDPSYYDDDVLFFDEHGERAIIDNQLSEKHPAVPLGAEKTNAGCNPFIFGYTFASLAKTREAANQSDANLHSILIPPAAQILVRAGGDGIDFNPHPVWGGDYGFSVAGAMDPASMTQPISLRIIQSRDPHGLLNLPEPLAFLNYENPMIGDSDEGNSCTNEQPQGWMLLQLKAEVSDLIPGKSYNLYEYDIEQISGLGREARLKIPKKNFNAHASQASQVTRFVASNRTFQQTIEVPSNRTVVFRCVAAEAP